MATRSNHNGSDGNSSNHNHFSGFSKREKQQLQRGLPNDEAREALARTYLEIQTRDWPELVKSGILPEFTDQNVNQLAEDFKTAFLNDIRDIPSPKQDSPIACAYVRFSDENSNCRSLAQQLRNILTRANMDGIFIEWKHVCADAAVSGTNTDRRDYQKLLGWMQKSGEDISHLYVDEVGRLNRNMAASFKLDELTRHHHIILVGASDGVNSSSEHSKMMIGMHAIQNEMFIDNLKKKVKRGMADGFTQGKNLQPPSFGYELIMLKDPNGEPLLNRHGKPQKKKVIKEEDVPWIIKAFELFAFQKWSRQKIAKLFNKHQVDGKTTWDSSRLKQLLQRPVYRGLECYGMTSQKKAPTTGKVKVINHPESEWQIREVPDLRIVPDELWHQAQARLDESLDTYRKKKSGKKKARCEFQQTLLVRPVCGYCGARLILGHSSRYQSFCCVNGREHKHGCQLTKYKSVRIVNKAILNKLHEILFTKEFLNQLVQEANQFLTELANRPQEDGTHLEKQIQKLKQQRDRLANLYMNGDEEGLEFVAKKLNEHSQQIKELEQEREQVKQRNAAPPPPLESDFVMQCLNDVETLLKEDVSVAAPILDALTGPIKVTQGETLKGQRGVPWNAEFTLEATRFMVELSRSQKYPSTGTWEFLNTHCWTNQKAVKLEFRDIPIYEERGREFLEMYQNGTSIQSIAAACGVSWEYVKAGINYIQTGERPDWNKVNSGKRISGPPRIPIYKQIADDVSRLRTKECMSFRKIVQWLLEKRGIKTSASTVNRAWDFKHPEAVQKAAQTGTKLQRGKSSRLGIEKVKLIHQLLKEGKSPKEIALKVGCGISTVRREQKNMG